MITKLLDNLTLKSWFWSNRRSISIQKTTKPIVRPIKKILVSNRGEIAVRIFRAAKELHIPSVAIYTEADLRQHHRLYSDESYLIGKGKDPVSAYLDGNSIVQIAKEVNANAIHPGYGFLSENGAFAQLCEENNIIFIGPSHQVVNMMGNKVACRRLAEKCGIPVIPGTEKPIESIGDAQKFVEHHGFPLIFKAAFGGGGRGMRICRDAEHLEAAFDAATSESLAAFGSGSLFIERYIENPRHIEIQILGDQYGNIVHLFERDCSIQRRFQKVIEIAPAPFICPSLRDKLTAMAVLLCKEAGYNNAGTVEFLVDSDQNVYFIEVNARLQVEHTVTEEVTGVDIVRSQIRIAEGCSLPHLNLGQANINLTGSAIQARVTTEDPKNKFTPDLGRISFYDPGTGPGIRLDGSCGFTGAIIQPHYDSLLTKVISKGSTFSEAREKLIRCLDEFTVKGVKTNLSFLRNVLADPDFVETSGTTDFISKHPTLVKFSVSEDPTWDILNFLGTVAVNGPQTPLGTHLKPSRNKPKVPTAKNYKTDKGWKDILDQKGPAGFAKAVLDHPSPLLTDTSFRDAHQSLLATRLRSIDLNAIAPFLARDMSKLFSLECWGGATFDASLRFLYECPWKRLEELRSLVPNIPLQMLLRGANAVGYKNYPDNVVYKFCKQAKESGMDIFRIFDALNYVPNIQVAMDSVNKAGGVVEAAICYSGDICNPERTKYSLDYYMKLAEQLISSGAHILCIKDMAGVLKPESAKILIGELKKILKNTPIHLHTHDTAGTGVATYLAAINAGCSVVDVACDSMSGMTSQPSMGALVAALSHTPQQSEIDLEDVAKYSSYFEQARLLYAPFESTLTLKGPNADVYINEIPGGQYTNLQFQAFSLGLFSQFGEIKQKYSDANELLGDIIKVTPTSKVVGDLAQFMVQNNLSKQDVLERASDLQFPNSTIEFFRGELGEPYGGYPEPFRTNALKGKSVVTGRPGATLLPLDFEKMEEELIETYGKENISPKDVLSYALYPQVFKDYMSAKKSFGPVEYVPTPFFFDKCQIGEEIIISLPNRPDMIFKLLAMSEPDYTGKRQVFVELNGSPITILILDKSFETSLKKNMKADETNKFHISAPMSGQVIGVKVSKGDQFKKGDVLFVLSAMKMETDITASSEGTIESIHVALRTQIEAGDLLAVFKS